MKSARSEAGFSLMEVTIALMVLTVVMGIAFTLLTRFQRSYRYEEAYADAQRNARFAMARLNEIIRTAGTNPTANTSVNPTNFIALLAPTTTSGAAVSSSSLRLKSDLNGDTLNNADIKEGDVLVTSEDVTLRFDSANGQILMDNNTKSPPESITIADNIRSIKFTDPNGAIYTNKVIQVQLVAVPSGIATGDPAYREVTYSTTIRLRNR